MFTSQSPVLAIHAGFQFSSAILAMFITSILELVFLSKVVLQNENFGYLDSYCSNCSMLHSGFSNSGWPDSDNGKKRKCTVDEGPGQVAAQCRSGHCSGSGSGFGSRAGEGSGSGSGSGSESGPSSGSEFFMLIMHIMNDCYIAITLTFSPAVKW